MRKTLTALGTVLAAAAPAAAQEPFVLDEIVFAANLGEIEASRTGTSVTVLGEEDLDRTSESRLTDLLARQPGIGIRSQGPLGTQTGITVRGVSQNYVKVLFDGIDISDPSGPQVAYDFGRLTSFGLDRVEILRGSQSAVYGSQAVAGVVNLQTALPREDGTTHAVEVEAGSYGTFSGNFSYGVRKGDDALGFNLSHVKTDGYSAANEADGNTEADGYEATRLSVKGETALGEGVTLGFSGFVERSKGDYDEFSIADGSPDEVSEATARGLRGFVRFETGRVEHEVAASAFTIDRTLSGSTGFGASSQDYEGGRQSLDWTASVAAGQAQLSFGADITWENYDQVSDFGFGASANGGSSRTLGAYAEWEAALSDTFDLTLSARADEHSEFGTFLTGRAAAAWRISSDVILRGAVGTGFRAPSGYELFGPYGDPSLTPEESVSADLGIEKQFGQDAFARATMFWIETDNLIDYIGGSYTQVAGTTRRQGLELEGETAISDSVRLTGAYTYTDSQNPSLSSGNTWNSGFGRHQLALGLDADLSDRLTASWGLLHVADRPTLDDYTTVNATFTYDLGNATEAYMRVQNLTDEQYELVDGYGTSDRAFYVGLRASF
ncbi:TonB-dependent receptor plug domain-containing protein [Rhodovulum sp. YNF3179]|uniref:TonB-dependent receptor plug domain-containing protein n=1 Tax=Rhodovulum sp. YNF3179 TaxID=3425127 RepID=UPI003D333D34